MTTYASTFTSSAAGTYPILDTALARPHPEGKVANRPPSPCRIGYVPPGTSYATSAVPKSAISTPQEFLRHGSAEARQDSFGTAVPKPTAPQRFLWHGSAEAHLPTAKAERPTSALPCRRNQPWRISLFLTSSGSGLSTFTRTS